MTATSGKLTLRYTPPRWRAAVTSLLAALPKGAVVTKPGRRPEWWPKLYRVSRGVALYEQYDIGAGAVRGIAVVLYTLKRKRAKKR